MNISNIFWLIGTSTSLQYYGCKTTSRILLKLIIKGLCRIRKWLLSVILSNLRNELHSCKKDKAKVTTKKERKPHLLLLLKVFLEDRKEQVLLNCNYDKTNVQDDDRVKNIIVSRGKKVQKEYNSISIQQLVYTCNNIRLRFGTFSHFYL